MAWYIKFDGVDGESKDSFVFTEQKDGNHDPWIDILSMNDGTSRAPGSGNTSSTNYTEVEWTYFGGQEGEPYTEVEWTY